MTLDHEPRGFTLVETILTVVLVGLVGTFLVVFLGDKLTHSADPGEWAAGTSAVEDTLEHIVSDCVVAMNSTTPETALTQIVANDSTYEALLGAQVDFSWIIFDAAGDEQAGTVGDNLKVQVSMNEDGDTRYTMTTVLPTTRYRDNDEPVNY